MDLVFINAYTKFYPNSSICSKILRKNTFLHQSRAITLSFINTFSPFAIPNNSSLVSMSIVHAKFEENRSKTTQVRVQKQSADGWMDGWMDGQTDGQMDTQNFWRV